MPKLTAKHPLRIGDKMPDGTVYVGVSPDTGEKMYAMRRDAPKILSFDEALAYAKKLKAHGHNDWRVPTKGELNVLFNNAAAIGHFDTSGNLDTGYYWSSTESDDTVDGEVVDAWLQRFNGGAQNESFKEDEQSVRFVRTTTAPKPRKTAHYKPPK